MRSQRTASRPGAKTRTKVHAPCKRRHRRDSMLTLEERASAARCKYHNTQRTGRMCGCAGSQARPEGGDITAPVPGEHRTAIKYGKAGSAVRLHYQEGKILERIAELGTSPSIYEASTESPARAVSTRLTYDKPVKEAATKSVIKQMLPAAGRAVEFKEGHRQTQ